MNSETFTPSALSTMDQARMRAYTENLDFYKGSHWTTAGRERRLVFNYARVNIDKVTSYLMTGFNWACDPLVDTPEARKAARQAETAIRQLWSRLGGRPWTYILRDIYHEAEWLVQTFFFVIGAAAGHFATWWALAAAWAVYTAGYVSGHLFWGTRWREGQGASRSGRSRGTRPS